MKTRNKFLVAIFLMASTLTMVNCSDNNRRQTNVPLNAYGVQSGNCMLTNGQYNPYCNQAGYSGMAQQCVGVYYLTQGGYSQMVQCAGYNCSGQMLVNQYNQPVLCQ